jgi:UDP-N-acetylmuramate: L-alanyl-gamma-D-glutamyl-meso-diaminopimelate ligase
VLTECGLDPSFLIGGVLRDHETSHRLGEGKHFVVEGDEYDTAFFDKGPKFLHYRPRTLVFGNLEFDHADIYKNLEEIEARFVQLLGLMPPDGLVIAGHEGDAVARVLDHARCRVSTFGFGEGATWRATNVAIQGDAMEFEVGHEGIPVARLRTHLVGEHNALNLMAAMAACREAGVEPARFAEAVGRFRGVHRRQEVRGMGRGVTVIDDFGHHPTAVRMTLESIRRRYPARTIWAAFEPRSATTRRNVFQKEWAGAFRDADRVVLAPLFAPEKVPAGELLDLDRLAIEIDKGNHIAYIAYDYDEILELILAQVTPGSVVVFFSSGGFGSLPSRLVAALGG